MTKGNVEVWIDKSRFNPRKVCDACFGALQRLVRATHDTTISELYDTDKEELVMLAGEYANASWAMTAERTEDPLGW